MGNTQKLVLFVVLICAGGYALRWVQAPKTMSPKNVATKKPTPGMQAALPVSPAPAPHDSLVYPTPYVEQTLNLGYKLFAAHADGSMTTVPLPPNLAMQTTLALSPAGHHQLELELVDAKCASALDIEAYRPDQTKAQWTGTLAAHQPATRVPLEKFSGGPLLLLIKLADGAQNNWFCNLSLKWDATAH